MQHQRRTVGFFFAVLVGMFAFHITAPTARAQTYYGFESALQYETFFDLDDYNNVEFSPALALRPIVTSYGDIYTFIAEGEVLTYDTAVHSSLSLRVIELELFILPWLTLNAGRFIYAPGSGEIFRGADFFASLNYEALLTGDFVRTIEPRDLLQLRLFIGPLYARLTADPFTRNLSLPAQSSPWFRAAARLPDPGEDSLVYEISQGQDIYQGISGMPTGMEGISGSIEVGGSMGPVAVTGYYFWGWSTELVPVTLGTLDQRASEVDATLLPYRNQTHLVAASFSTVVGSWRAWFEGNYQTDRALVTDELWFRPFSQPIEFETRVQTGQYGELIGGLSYSLQEYRTDITAEGIFGVPEASLANGTEKPLIYRNAALSVRQRPRTGKTSFFAGGLLSFEDLSFVVFGSIGYSFSEQAMVQVKAPLFVGGDETAFGRYSDIQYLNLNLSLVF